MSTNDCSLFSCRNHHLFRLNSHVAVTTHCAMLSSSNALEILTHYDIIVDATDNVATRFWDHSVYIQNTSVSVCVMYGVLASFPSGTS